MMMTITSDHDVSHHNTWLVCKIHCFTSFQTTAHCCTLLSSPQYSPPFPGDVTSQRYDGMATFEHPWLLSWPHECDVLDGSTLPESNSKSTCQEATNKRKRSSSNHVFSRYYVSFTEGNQSFVGWNTQTSKAKQSKPWVKSNLKWNSDRSCFGRKWCSEVETTKRDKPWNYQTYPKYFSNLTLRDSLIKLPPKLGLMSPWNSPQQPLLDPRGQFRQEDPVGATAFQVSPKINCLYGCFQTEVASMKRTTFWALDVIRTCWVCLKIMNCRFIGFHWFPNQHLTTSRVT